MKKRYTLTLDPTVVELINSDNRSAVVNAILKEHYQYGARDKLYEYVVDKLLQDVRLSDYVFNKSQENRTEEDNYDGY